MVVDNEVEREKVRECVMVTMLMVVPVLKVTVVMEMKIVMMPRVYRPG